MTRLVLASANAGKLAELRALLADAGVELVAQSQLGVEEVEETGLSFVENALLKARHAAMATGLPALADDSGLCVDALGGAPGLYSARFAGRHGDSAANNARLLRELEGLDLDQRRAHFHAVIVLLRHAGDPQPLIAEGVWPGTILHAPRGTGGFGYDPIFIPDDQPEGAARTAGEFSAAEKNAASHRARAFVALAPLLASLPGD